MSLDFYGVTISGRIRTFPKLATGSPVVYELWLDPNSGRPPDPEVPLALSFVQEVSVEINLGFNSKISLLLAPPFDEAMKLLNSPLIKWGVGHLEVMIGYTTGQQGTSGGLVSLPFSGLIQKPDVSIGSDINITINALGVGFALNQTGGVKEEIFDEGSSSADAIMKVLSKYTSGGLDISRLFEGMDSSHSIFNIPKNGRRIIKGDKNDWWFVYDLLREHGLDMFVHSDRINLVKGGEERVRESLRILNPDEWMFGKPGRTFVLRGQIRPEREIYPILDFTSPTAHVWLVPGVGMQVMRDISAGGEVQEKVFDDTTVGPARTGNGAINTSGPTSIASVPQEHGRNYPGNPESMEHAGSAEYKNQAYRTGIHVEILTLGIPDLKPGEMVEVLGFSTESGKPGIFDGLYGVTEVRHNIGAGGYTTWFRGIGNFYPQVFGNAANAKNPNPYNKDIHKAFKAGEDVLMDSRGNFIEVKPDGALSAIDKAFPGKKPRLK